MKMKKTDAARKRMVERQLIARGISDPQVLAAMSTVPREKFVPEPYIQQAYDDVPLPIGYGQTISQPYIVALMTQLAYPQPDHRVLDIGTGQQSGTGSYVKPTQTRN